MLFAINHTNTGEETPPVFVPPHKERAVEDDDFVLIPEFTTIPEEAEDDFESEIDDVKSSLQKLHKRLVVNARRIVLQEADLV